MMADEPGPQAPPAGPRAGARPPHGALVRPRPRRNSPALLWVLCLFAQAGCRRPVQAPGSVILANSFPGACAHPVSGTAVTASMDGGPVVAVADDARFQFANLAPGAHTLAVRAVFPRPGASGVERTLRLDVPAGGTDRVEIDCASDGSPSLSEPAAP